MARYPAGFSQNFEVITMGMDIGEIGNQAVSELAEHGFVAAQGCTQYQADTLVRIAQEKGIAEYCPRDRQRFGSVRAIEDRFDGEKGNGMVGIYAAVDSGPLTEHDLLGIAEEDVDLAAYGWTGVHRNLSGTGSHITTAFRVGERGRELARARHGSFRLGLPLGKLVIALGVEVHGADPAELELETYGSNRAAGRLYDALGFKVYNKEMATRPTLRPVGDNINGHIVYADEASGATVVSDERIFMRYDASRYP